MKIGTAATLLFVAMIVLGFLLSETLSTKQQLQKSLQKSQQLSAQVIGLQRIVEEAEARVTSAESQLQQTQQRLQPLQQELNNLQITNQELVVANNQLKQDLLAIDSQAEPSKTTSQKRLNRDIAQPPNAVSFGANPHPPPISVTLMLYLFATLAFLLGFLIVWLGLNVYRRSMKLPSYRMRQR